MSLSNSLAHLDAAKTIFIGELADNNRALKEARDTRNSSLWEVLCHLICHAQQVVFENEYTKAKARRFKDDVVASFSISEKQAGKWTESISAALGVRGTRKGVVGIKGLSAAAAEGLEMTKAFLIAREIETFNQFMQATRAEKSDIDALATKLHKLSTEKRTLVLEKVAAFDKADAAETAEAQQAATA